MEGLQIVKLIPDKKKQNLVAPKLNLKSHFFLNLEKSGNNDVLKYVLDKVMVRLKKMKLNILYYIDDRGHLRCELQFI